VNMHTHPAASAQTILSVQGLAKHFEMHHLKRTLHAFDKVDFELREGEFILLTGENGAGKSTLLRTLYRSYVPRAGHAYYHTREGVIDLTVAADVDIALLRKREIGFVTQFLQAAHAILLQRRVTADQQHRTFGAKCVRHAGYRVGGTGSRGNYGAA